MNVVNIEEAVAEIVGALTYLNECSLAAAMRLAAVRRRSRNRVVYFVAHLDAFYQPVPIVQRPRTWPFQGQNTGSNPVGDEPPTERDPADVVAPNLNRQRLAAPDAETPLHLRRWPSLWRSAGRR